MDVISFSTELVFLLLTVMPRGPWQTAHSATDSKALQTGTLVHGSWAHVVPSTPVFQNVLFLADIITSAQPCSN